MLPSDVQQCIACISCYRSTAVFCLLFWNGSWNNFAKVADIFMRQALLLVMFVERSLLCWIGSYLIVLFACFRQRRPRGIWGRAGRRPQAIQNTVRWYGGAEIAVGRRYFCACGLISYRRQCVSLDVMQVVNFVFKLHCYSWFQMTKAPYWTDLLIHILVRILPTANLPDVGANIGSLKTSKTRNSWLLKRVKKHHSRIYTYFGNLFSTFTATRVASPPGTCGW